MKKYFYFIVIIALFFGSAAMGQDATVRWVSGAISNTGDYSGDGGPDSLAKFNNVCGLCFDASGNMFILDAGNYRIRKVDAVTHIITTIAGNGTKGFSGDGGPAVLAQLGLDTIFNYSEHQSGICCDNSGNVYLADAYNGRIRKINTSTGIITTIAGGGTNTGDYVPAISADIFPNKICMDRNLNIFVTDARNAIREIDAATGLIHTVVGAPGIDPATFTELFDISCDTAGNLYYVDYEQALVGKRDTSGLITVLAKLNLSATNHISGYPGYTSGFSGDGGLAANAVINPSEGILVDGAGNVYFNDDGMLLRKINQQTGIISTIIGVVRGALTTQVGSWETLSFNNHTIGIHADSVYLFIPVLAISPTGKLYYSDYNSIFEYNRSAVTVKSAVITDSLLTPDCVMPVRSFGFHGVIDGVPSPADSMNIVLNYNDGTPPASYKLPYYSFLDSSGATVYGFGGTNNWIGEHAFSIPGKHPVSVYYEDRHGNADLAVNQDLAGSSCDTNISWIFLESMKDTIVSLPCSSTPAIRIDVMGGIYGGAPTTADSVYILIDYGDSTSDVHVVRYDSVAWYYPGCFGGSNYHFHYSGYHNYPPGFTGTVTPHVDAMLNSGRAFSDLLCGTGCMPEFPVVYFANCSAGDSLTSSITTVDSTYTICALPFTASFNIGSSLYLHADTTSSLSYYVNFGDGSDTTITVAESTDGLGHYYMRDTIQHTYTMPGAYITAITPSDTTGRSLGSTLTLGTSCSPLSGVFYRDGNGNCTADTGETLLRYWPMAVINNTLSDTTYAWCDTFGHYALILIDGDSYTIIPNYFGPFGLDSTAFLLSCPSATGYTITPASGSSYTQDFGFTCAGSPTDMDMNVSGWTWGVVPGDTGVVGVWSSNTWGYMCDSLTSTVTLTLDPLLTYLGMWDGPAPTTVSGSTLSWTFSTEANLLDFNAHVKVVTSTSATMGASVCNTLSVTPTAITDSDLSNNTYSWCEPVRSSWDPNEKQVSPKGYGPEGYIQNGTPLSYIIHFQNTGTAPARNITVNDTVDNNLDIATLQVISASGSVLVYQPELTGRVIKFRFNDINLPDSMDNPSGSIGYISYNILPKPNLAAGTQIQNKGGIYFDYNPAVVTNSTLNTIEDTVGGIAGATSVCPGATITLTNALAGGVWASSNPHATIVDGVVTGVSEGVDTISYTVYGDRVVTKIVSVLHGPDAGSVSGVTSVCPGATTTLTPTLAGGVWTSGSHVSVAGGVVTGLSSGVDTVHYAVTNTCGTTSVPTIITVNPLPDAGTISGTTTVCVGATTTLSSTVTGGAWTSGSHVSVSGGAVTGLSAGTDTVHYAVTNSCGIATVPTVVTINPLADPGTVSGITTLCAGTTTTLSATVAGGTWISGTHTAVSGGVVTALSAGTDTVRYGVSNSCGTVTVPTVITINPLPDAGSISAASTLCVGSSTTVSATVTAGVWSSTSAGSIAGGVLTGVTAGTDTVSYTVTNTCGSVTTSTFFTVVPLPDAGILSGTSTVCVGNSTTLSSTMTGGTWTTSSATATVSGGVVTGVTAGTDTVTYSITNSCGAASATEVITVNPLPVAGSISGADTVCVGDTIMLSNTVTGGVWSSLSSAVATVSGTGMVIGVAPGTTDIDYSATNSCGTASTSHVVTVLSLADCNLSVVNIDKGAFRIYPNPSNGTFTIEIPAPGNNATITIMDVYGKVIEQRLIDNKKSLIVPVVMSNVASGTYLIKVDADGISYRDKMIVW